MDLLLVAEFGRENDAEVSHKDVGAYLGVGASRISPLGIAVTSRLYTDNMKLSALTNEYFQ